MIMGSYIHMYKIGMKRLTHEILILISPLLSISLAALSTIVEVVFDVDPHQRKSQQQSQPQ